MDRSQYGDGRLQWFTDAHPNHSNISVTEIDIDLDATAGTFHIFEPNVNAAIASKYLYLCAGSACDTALTAFRGTLEIEYSVY